MTEQRHRYLAKMLERRKTRLWENERKYVRHESMNGDTETGFYSTDTFNLDDLLKEIDDFGKEVRDRAERLGLK